MFLTEVELQTLTGQRRSKAQARTLERMGIEHRVNLRGDVIVSRRRVEEILGCSSQTATTRAPVEPNWKALANA